MKKTVFLFCALCLTFVMVFCHSLFAKTAADDSCAEYDAFLIGESIDFTKTMAKLAASDSYTSAMIQSPEIALIFDEIAAGKYEKPAAVYFLTLSPQKTEKLMEIALSLEGRKLEPFAKQELLKKIDGFSFAKMMNGQFGSSFIAAAAVLETGKSYIEPKNWSGAVSVLLIYPGTYASLTQFRQSGDGVISAQATFTVFGDTMREILAKSKDPFFDILGEEFFSIQKK